MFFIYMAYFLKILQIYAFGVKKTNENYNNYIYSRELYDLT